MPTKRSLNATEDITSGNDAYLKRQKISHQKSSHVAASAEDIQSSRQLKQLLAFDQDAQRSRHGIQSFKIFLDGFAEAPNRKSILQEYLQSQKPTDPEDSDPIFLKDIMQTWSFASQSNNDSLLSGVPALLALLLRTLLSILELSDYGILLGTTLLKKRQLELISRCLSTNSSKEFVISPALRLLKEVASSDGVLLAKLFRARDSTFKSLGRNLRIRTKAEDPKKPSVRSNAVRFLLTCIRLLSADAKSKICHMPDVVAGLFRSLNDDPPSLVEDILKTLRIHIIQDKLLPRDARKKMLNSANLRHIVTLYDKQYVTKEGETPIDASQVAHEFLIAACTTPDIGILHPQRGFYPRDGNLDRKVDHPEGDRGFIDLGLDSLEWANKFKTGVPVKNTHLSDFIKSFTPWPNIKQAELLLTIFRAAPELVAYYWLGKKDANFDPKLSATWIAYSALVFATVSLPLPDFFGHRDGFANLPPPTSLVIESIIPAPVTQKALTKCLNHKSKLIRFFGVRLLTIALKKLKDALRMYTLAADGQSKIWDQAKEKLVDEFCERCPAMHDAINVFKDVSKTDLMQREATAKLLMMYFELIPKIALDAKREKLDTSSPLIEALEMSKHGFPRREDTALHAMITEHLFQIASYSPGMRWFAKVEPLNLSPFIAMLQQALSTTSDYSLSHLIQAVASENHILQSGTEQSSANALVASLNLPEASAVGTFEFLDNCVLRCSKTPIKYFEQLEEFYTEVYGNEQAAQKMKDSPTSLLLVVILEQWPFVVKSKDNTQMKEVAQFNSRYLAASLKIKEDKKVIKLLTKKLVDETPEDSPCRKILDKSRKLADEIEIREFIPPKPQQELSQSAVLDPEEEKAQIISAMMEESMAPPDDNNALTRWLTKDIEEVVEDGHAAALVMLLSSPDLAFRKEAMARLRQFAAKLKESSYEEKEQTWLLLCELMETGRDQIDERPLQTSITAFASHAIAVLANPLHCMYPKINKFLTQGPKWEVNYLPLMHSVLHDAPSLDDAGSQEVEWLLQYMIMGLRTKEDMDVYRRRRVFEKVLSLYNNPYARAAVKDKILVLVFKAIRVEGGSETLITRFSGLSWTQAQTALDNGDRVKKLRVLMEELSERSDGDKIKKWMRGETTRVVVEATVGA